MKASHGGAKARRLRKPHTEALRHGERRENHGGTKARSFTEARRLRKSHTEAQRHGV